jgi:hypothetical protein
MSKEVTLTTIIHHFHTFLETYVNFETKRLDRNEMYILFSEKFRVMSTVIEKIN